MRVLFGLDATHFTDVTSLERAMTGSDINWVRRIGHNGDTTELLWIVGKLDFLRLYAGEMAPDDMCYQEITSCNKQYVTQYDKNHNVLFLGSVCSVTQEEAGERGSYILDMTTGEFWTFEERNPDRMVRARGVVEELQDGFDVIDQIHDALAVAKAEMDEPAEEFTIDKLFGATELQELNAMEGVTVMSLNEFMDIEMAPWPEDPAAPTTKEPEDREYQTKFIYGHGYG